MAPSTGPSISWEQLFETWNLIELDLHEIFGIDSSDKTLLANRTWRWYKTRIVGLLSTESRTQRVLNPPEDKE